MGFDKFYRKIVHKGGSAVYGLKVYSQTLTFTAGNIPGNEATPYVFTVTGLSTDDKILSIQGPRVLTASPVVIASYRVTAANTLEILFANTTLTGATPVGGTYKIVVLRAISADEV